jgi:aminobenzoyl-glutamate utilization protein B
MNPLRPLHHLGRRVVRAPIWLTAAATLALAAPFWSPLAAQDVDALISEVDQGVQDRAKLVQVMIDKIFSFSELGHREFETSAYVTGILEENGFEIERGVSGMPTAWFARWGSGRPVIAFGSDLDGIPKANQTPGVAYHQPLVEGAPGHGEGHNSGQAVNVAAALALKEIMEREGIEGTLVLWPGVAEEQIASKAWFVRDGLFDGIDAVLFTHVSNNLTTSWGPSNGTGLVSVEFTFEGEAAHGAGAPWRGRSALDAVELMNTGWNYWREHMNPTQRSHYVITDGGDQPNVVPSVASVWYYIREMEYENIQANYEAAIRIAEGAALMTNTDMSYRVRGAAWPRHFNRVIAETANEHIQAVGLPEWSDADHRLAEAAQAEVGSVPSGLATALSPLGRPGPNRRSGGSDDIGDISWTVPTITLRFPSNIPGLPGHHWANAIAMATPIAHKGGVAGARVMARTALQLFLQPALVDQAWDYFREDQGAAERYVSFITDDDPAPIDLNESIDAQFRPLLEPLYYDETRFDTYLEQLGISYPTVREADNAPADAPERAGSDARIPASGSAGAGGEGSR